MNFDLNAKAEKIASKLEKSAGEKKGEADLLRHPPNLSEENNFPTVPLFNRKQNFSKFDIDTLFFAFYYQ